MTKGNMARAAASVGGFLTTLYGAVLVISQTPACVDALRERVPDLAQWATPAVAGLFVIAGGVLQALSPSLQAALPRGKEKP